MESPSLISKLLVAVGVCVLALASLTLISTIRDLVLMMRFGGPTRTYIGAANLGYMIFDGAITLVLLLVGGFLVRRYIRNGKVQLIAFIVAVLAIILGVNAGLMVRG
jgi:hypothetical protein